METGGTPAAVSRCHAARGCGTIRGIYEECTYPCSILALQAVLRGERGEQDSAEGVAAARVGKHSSGVQDHSRCLQAAGRTPAAAYPRECAGTDVQAEVLADASAHPGRDGNDAIHVVFADRVRARACGRDVQAASAVFCRSFACSHLQADHSGGVLRVPHKAMLLTRSHSRAEGAGGGRMGSHRAVLSMRGQSQADCAGGGLRAPLRAVLSKVGRQAVDAGVWMMLSHRAVLSMGGAGEVGERRGDRDRFCFGAGCDGDRGESPTTWRA